MSTHDMNPPRTEQSVSKLLRNKLDTARTSLKFAGALIDPLAGDDELPTNVSSDVDSAREFVEAALKMIERACVRARV